jgi:hypothetical protein
MRPVIFLGPTLAIAQARRILDADYRPPATKGDVFKAVKCGASAIGIIDGYFQSRPAVWHKEILWALHNGVHVFGSASMGAIRAAELAPFGMIGVGDIYRHFAASAVTADDAVAIHHGPAELGYPALSVALVDIAETLASALRHGVIDAEVMDGIERIATRTFYPLRQWNLLLASAQEEGFAAPQLAELAEWVSCTPVSIKAADAEAMLCEMAKFLESDPAPHRPSFGFEPTLLWRRMVGELENPILQMLWSDPR